MIRISCNGRDTYVCSPSDALKDLLFYKIGVGCAVVFTSATAIKLHDERLYGVYDEVWFRGDEQDMRLLVEAAVLWIDITYERQPLDRDSLIDAQLSINPRSLGFEFFTQEIRSAQNLAAKILLNLSTDSYETAERIHFLGVDVLGLLEVVHDLRERTAGQDDAFDDDMLLSGLTSSLVVV